MGAIFNTDGTKKILNKLNDSFGIAVFQNNIKPNNQLVTDLRKPVAQYSTYSLCVDYGFITDDNNVNTHWGVWLNYFDKNDGQKIRNDIADAIQNDNDCVGIEFFAVPAATWKVRQSHKLPHQGNKHTLIISVETPTYDQL
jgi:hypothetical protein